jgi:hypothetical protein
VTLGERLRALLDSLPSDWSEARVVVTVVDEAEADRAALILAPLAPGRSGKTFRLTITASGGGAPSPDAAARVLERLDQDGIDARISLPGTAAFQVQRPAPPPPKKALAKSWDELLARLPADWSDLYLELELASSDEIDRTALLLAPTNPFLHEGIRPAFRFRAARRFGYGVAPSMARRALERLDEASIAGQLRVLRVQSETNPVLTQGPVWREGGRAI